MKKFKFVFFAALLMFLDIVVVPHNECGKKYYYLVFEVEIVNVEQSDNGYMYAKVPVLLFQYNYS